MGLDLALQRVIDRFELVSGIGEPNKGTMCAMSFVAYLAGEGHTDRPSCVSPMIRDFVIPINDDMPREARQRLKPFVPRLMGTNDGLDRTRAEVLRRALVEVILPRASGGCRVSSPGEPAWRIDSLKRLWIWLRRGRLVRHIGRLLEEGAGNDHRLGWEAELAGAVGHLLSQCARDAPDAREAEWYWGQAIGLLDRLCEVGAQRRRGVAAGARAGRSAWLEAHP